MYCGFPKPPLSEAAAFRSRRALPTRSSRTTVRLAATVRRLGPFTFTTQTQHTLSSFLDRSQVGVIVLHYEQLDREEPIVTTVLVVNREEGAVARLKDYLEADGLRVVIARDGPAGLDLAHRESPPLILLDLMPPAPATTASPQEAGAKPAR